MSTSVPSDFIPVIADMLIRLRENLTDFDPLDWAGKTAVERKKFNIIIKLLDLMMEFMENMTNELRVIIQNNNAEEVNEAVDRMMMDGASLFWKFDDFICDAEISAFGNVSEEAAVFLRNTKLDTFDNIMEYLGIMIYRSARLDANINGTTTEQELANMVGLDAETTREIEYLIKQNGTFTGISSFLEKKFMEAVDEKKHQSSKPTTPVVVLGN